jgi:hypothetical protein
MRSGVLIAFLVCCAAFSHDTKSEILGGIPFWASLEDVKKLYPSATFTNMKPAWAQEDDRLIKIDGRGLGVSYVVLFWDRASFARRSLAIAKQEGSPLSEESLLTLSTLSDERSLVVQWVRMIHPEPIPIERYRAKYGTPTCSVNSTMDQVCKWPSRALDALMSDDGKFVLHSTNNFTEAEQLSGLRPPK